MEECEKSRYSAEGGTISGSYSVKYATERKLPGAPPKEETIGRNELGGNEVPRLDILESINLVRGK